MKDCTVGESLTMWSQPTKNHKVSCADQKNVRTALKNYVFPLLGLCSQEIGVKGFGDVCNKLKLSVLMNACLQFDDKLTLLNEQDSPHNQQIPNPQEDLPEFLLYVLDHAVNIKITAGKLSKESKRNYRPPLSRYLKWVTKQCWWQDMFPENMPEVAPVHLTQLKKPTTKPRQEPYILEREELPKPLIQELETYRLFRLDGGKELWQKIRQQERDSNRSKQEQARHHRRAKPKLNSVAESTYEYEEMLFRGFWGWSVKFGGYNLSDLTLEMLTDLALLEDYVYWRVQICGLSHAQPRSLVCGAIGVAKFLNFGKTEVRNWSDILILGKLRDLLSEYEDAYEKEHAGNVPLRWEHLLITHDELEQLLPYLRQRSAPYSGKVSKLTGKTVKGAKRSDARVVWYYQAYLLIKYFTYCPNRQQEPRQYVHDKTLFRELDKNGEYRYFARNIRHKNERFTDRLRNYPLPKILTRDFDEWIQKYRPKAELAIQSLDNWLIFWGHEPNALSKLDQRLESARQGNIPASIKNKKKYLENLENDFRSLQACVDSYPIAKANFEKHNSLFFTVGIGRNELFGTPLSRSSVYYIVTTSVAIASEAVFEKPAWNSPHSFRHIAEATVRKNGGNKAKVSKMLNHNEKEGDEYADQIIEEFEEFEDVVDNWFE